MYPNTSENDIDFSRVIFHDWMIHPPAVLIDQYVSGLLEGEALTHIEQHLGICPYCRNDVESLRAPCPPIILNAENVSPDRKKYIRQMIHNFAARPICARPDTD